MISRESTGARRDRTGRGIRQRRERLLASLQDFTQSISFKAEAVSCMIDRDPLANNQAYRGPVNCCFVMIIMALHSCRSGRPSDVKKLRTGATK